MLPNEDLGYSGTASMPDTQRIAEHLRQLPDLLYNSEALSQYVELFSLVGQYS